jgi:hypothetical protein
MESTDFDDYEDWEMKEMSQRYPRYERLDVGALDRSLSFLGRRISEPGISSEYTDSIAEEIRYVKALMKKKSRDEQGDSLADAINKSINSTRQFIKNDSESGESSGSGWSSDRKPFSDEITTKEPISEDPNTSIADEMKKGKFNEIEKIFARRTQEGLKWPDPSRAEELNDPNDEDDGFPPPLSPVNVDNDDEDDGFPPPPSPINVDNDDEDDGFPPPPSPINVDNDDEDDGFPPPPSPINVANDDEDDGVLHHLHPLMLTMIAPLLRLE